MLDISRLSPAELDRFLYLQAEVDRQKEAQDTVKALRDYYYGNHPILLTTRQQEFLGPMIKEPGFKFAHNLVRTIVDTLRERLNVVGFTVNGESADALDDQNPTPEGKLAGLLWSWWNANRMDSEQIRCHRRALRDGETYAIVDFDSETGRPRINLHKKDDGKTGITFHRDPTNMQRTIYANRYWYDYNPLVQGVTGTERKTTYLPHEVRKYIKRASGDWEPYSQEDNGVWPLPWRDAQGQPLGIPVIEFANPGGSEMTQVIGLQNAVNKSWLDLIAGADSSGFPVVIAEYPPGTMPTEAEDDDDLTGTDEFRLSPGRLVEVEGTIKRLEAANLTPMLDVVWALVQAMSGVSRTPTYYLKPVGGNDVPSGEALKQLESGLVQRAKERQLMFGQSWTDVAAMMMKVARAFGSETIPEIDNMEIAPVWDDPNTRNEFTQAQTAQIYKTLDMPDEYVWTTAGVSPEEIAAFKDNARADKAKDVATIAESLRLSQQRTAQQTNPQPFGNNQNGQNGNGAV
jgi:hypothetical protein